MQGVAEDVRVTIMKQKLRTRKQLNPVISKKMVFGMQAIINIRNFKTIY